jgi:hypothetical protein
MSGTITASPAAAFASTPFSDAEKADIRRFCGYPPYGFGPQGFQGWRFFEAYGLLEYRMINFAPAEIQNVRYFLSQLNPLETAQFGASANLSTDAAGVWTHNKNEVADRIGLFLAIRRQLVTLVGVPPGPDLQIGFQRRI